MPKSSHAGPAPVAKATPAPGPAAVPPRAATAFGVTIADAKQSSAARPPMTRERKQLIGLGAVLVLAGLGYWYLNYDAGDIDPDAAKNPGVREVNKLQAKRDTAGLANLARSSDTVVAQRAVTALADVGGPETVRDSLTDRRPEVRYAAVNAMGVGGDVSRLPTLSKFTQDPASDVRVAAIRGISNIRDFTIFDHLIPTLNDPDASVRQAALGAIEDRIGLKFPDFKVDDPQSNRARAIARMRAQIAQMKQVFDRANAFEAAREQKAGSKSR